MPDVPLSAELQTLAKEVRAARKRLGWTLNDLSIAAALDKGYLSKVERGLKAPSLATVLNLAKVLRVPVGRLFGSEIDESTIQVVRARTREQATQDGSYLIEPLTQAEGGIEGFLVHPRAEFSDDFGAQHDGDELLYVLAGSVEVRFADRTLTLEKGDTLQFPGRLQHRLRRLSPTACVLVAISRAAQ